MNRFNQNIDVPNVIHDGMDKRTFNEALRTNFDKIWNKFKKLDKEVTNVSSSGDTVSGGISVSGGVIVTGTKLSILENFEYDKKTPTYNSQGDVIQYDYEKPVGNNIAVMILTYTIYTHISTASITGANTGTLTFTYLANNKDLDKVVLT